MKIRDIKVHRLIGGTVNGGWPEGHVPEDDLHALIEVVADDGITGIGSVFTDSDLVIAAVDSLRAHWERESAIEPERVSEKLRQSSFWKGRGGTLEHVISGIDIALWDLFGKVCGQPVARLLGGYYRRKVRPYASLLFDEPEILAERLHAVTSRGFRAIKLGWRPFGRRDSKFDELLVRVARETVERMSNCSLTRAVASSFGLMVTNGRCERRRCWPTMTSVGSKKRCRRTTSTGTSDYASTLPFQSPGAKC